MTASKPFSCQKKKNSYVTIINKKKELALHASGPQRRLIIKGCAHNSTLCRPRLHNSKNMVLSKSSFAFLQSRAGALKHTLQRMRSPTRCWQSENNPPMTFRNEKKKAQLNEPLKEKKRHKIISLRSTTAFVFFLCGLSAWFVQPEKQKGKLRRRKRWGELGWSSRWKPDGGKGTCRTNMWAEKEN